MSQNCRRRLFLDNNIERVDDTWHVTEECQNDVDPEVFFPAPLVGIRQEVAAISR